MFGRAVSQAIYIARGIISNIVTFKYKKRRETIKGQCESSCFWLWNLARAHACVCKTTSVMLPWTLAISAFFSYSHAPVTSRKKTNCWPVHFLAHDRFLRGRLRTNSTCLPFVKLLNKTVCHLPNTGRTSQRCFLPCSVKFQGWQISMLSHCRVGFI